MRHRLNARPTGRHGPGRLPGTALGLGRGRPRRAPSLPTASPCTASPPCPRASPTCPTRTPTRRSGPRGVGRDRHLRLAQPYVLQGTVPWQLTHLVTETLMGRSLDEPFSLYGLLAESVETAPDRSWVEFTLAPRPASRRLPRDRRGRHLVLRGARDGGHPRYATFWSKVESIEARGERSVRITFNTEDRELAMLAGLRPSSSGRSGRAWTSRGRRARLIPITSARVRGHRLRGRPLRHAPPRPRLLGRDLPCAGRRQPRRGPHRVLRRRDRGFESFKVGETTLVRETNPQRWATQYDFPRVQSGEVTLSVIPTRDPRA
jgi:peptide/nickel transport system substrate-binding protein